jgi:carbamoylphosphate synthase small subunit
MLSIRYHREALPSARDNLCLFHQFAKMVRVQKT